MDDWELRRLASLVFQHTRRDVWFGGVAHQRMADWPKDVVCPDWDSGVVWTISPAIELGGHQIRVCVSATPYRFRTGSPCGVRVFVDGYVGYPGGHYEQGQWVFPFFRSFFENWAARLARIEIEEGGRTGPVDRRDVLIHEATERLHGARVHHPLPLSPEAKATIREMEELEALAHRMGASVRLEKQR